MKNGKLDVKLEPSDPPPPSYCGKYGAVDAVLRQFLKILLTKL